MHRHSHTKELLRVAKSDLLSSRVLNEQSLFSQAYFSFQQSVEKCNKALGLLTGIITPDDLLEFRHDQIKIYKKLIYASEEKIEKHLKEMEPFEAAKNHTVHREMKMEMIPMNAKKARQFFDSLRNIDLVNVDEQTVDFFIAEIVQLQMQERNVDILTHELELTDRMFQVADWIGSFGTPEALAAKEELIAFFRDPVNRNDFFKAINDYMWLIIDFAYIQVTLYFFVLLTIQHSSQTRYISEDGISPLDLYTEKLPVVSRLPKMISLMSEAIARFENINTLILKHATSGTT